ncbi:MAG: RES family NAD+ phosphorylase [Bacteroidota bacterium]
MHVYRICKRKYSNDLSGVGAGLYGGRWNPRGMNLLYTAGSISLACLEYLVHNIHLSEATDICLSIIEIPDDSKIHSVTKESLPDDWNETSYLPHSTQSVGEDFINAGKNYILMVPSAVVPNEFNYLINPQHSDHTKTKTVKKTDPFELDSRLFQTK